MGQRGGREEAVASFRRTKHVYMETFLLSEHGAEQRREHVGGGRRASECPSCGVQNADFSCRALALQAAEVRLDFQRRGASALVSKCVPVCLSGGRDKRGGPILTFPARSNHDRIRQEDLRRLISYLACIPR